MLNINPKEMNIKDEIEDILYATDLKPSEVKRLTEKLLNLHSVSKSYYSDDAIEQRKTEYFEKWIKENK